MLVLARNGKIRNVDQYIAVGTGMKSTKKEYPQIYNYSEPQRDIVWTTKNQQLVLTQGSNAEVGNIAGLQIEASLKIGKYLAKELTSDRYQVPVVFFHLYLHLILMLNWKK